MASRNEDGGVHLDVEIKILFAATSYAIMKFISSYSTSLAGNIGRSVFVLGHVLYILNSLKTQQSVKKMSISHEVKTDILTKLKSSFRGVVGRALVICLIHWRTGMLPPLFISVCLSFCDAFEIPDFLDTLTNGFPKVFGSLANV